MSNIPYRLIHAQEGVFVNANGLRFEPLDEEPYHFGVEPEKKNLNEIYRAARGKQNRSSTITGQTCFNRYPELFRAAVHCIQSARPGQIKHILSAPSSIGAEAVTLAARVLNMNLLHQYRFECVDICAEYINHARTFQFPGGMLIRQPQWLQDAFQVSAKPPNDETLWIEPLEVIKEAIHIHDPKDMTEFQSDHKYDVIFMMTLFTHLTATQQTAVLENMMRHCNGLLCFDVKPPRAEGDIHYRRSESMIETISRIRDILQSEGFAFADTSDQTIKLSQSGATRMFSGLAGVTVAIHPDLAAQLS